MSFIEILIRISTLRIEIELEEIIRITTVSKRVKFDEPSAVRSDRRGLLHGTGKYIFK